MPLGEDCDLLGPFPGRTASGHGIRIANDGSVGPTDVDQLSSPGSQRMNDQKQIIIIMYEFGIMSMININVDSCE